MHSVLKYILIGCAATALTACASGGGGMGSIFADNSAKQADVAPEPIEPAQPLAPSGLSQTEIRKAIGGKSWRWSGPNNSGVTLYANDGTSMVEVDGKGTTTGKWRAKDGQLCESFSPAPFLPGGVPESCAPISGSGNNYMVGKARFTLG